MGCFSFYRADMTTKQANFVAGQTVKLLIPKEFVHIYGAKFLKGTLDNYGCVSVLKPDGTSATIDVYGFVAFINQDMEYEGATVKDHYKTSDNGWEDTNDQDNRCIGISLACYPEDHVNCKFHLKLVSPSYRGTYESTEYFSTGDGAQGWNPEYWDDESYCGSVRDYVEQNCAV